MKLEELLKLQNKWVAFSKDRKKVVEKASSLEDLLKKILVDCLFDTGADRNLFPAAWGRSLGLKIEKGELVKTMGIGGKEIKAYTHKVVLFVQGHKIITEADFTDENNTPLLGRDGFMDKFEDIVINEKKKFVR